MDQARFTHFHLLFPGNCIFMTHHSPLTTAYYDFGEKHDVFAEKWSLAIACIMYHRYPRNIQSSWRIDTKRYIVVEALILLKLGVSSFKEDGKHKWVSFYMVSDFPIKNSTFLNSKKHIALVYLNSKKYHIHNFFKM